MARGKKLPDEIVDELEPDAEIEPVSDEEAPVEAKTEVRAQQPPVKPVRKDDSILIEYLDTGQMDRVSASTAQEMFAKGRRIKVR